ncbi:MAG: general secretion pathway protein GspA [marine bacterium B5-7]|nr:MAG: general secretion pathway protein GspA [marine bacterium B5-7]
MYLEHFDLAEQPFSLNPDLDYYCDLSNSHDILAAILACLAEGDGFVKIVGEVGVGKTTLCRRLLDSLGDDIVSCYILNPDLNPVTLHKSIATELGIKLASRETQHTVLRKIYATLLTHHRAGKRVVLVVDEAQALSDKCLESLRLLTNLETESSKLLQVVLIGQPELDERLRTRKLRQIQQRIAFNFYLGPLSKTEIGFYVASRLVTAGHRNGQLFDNAACKSLFKATQGVPRVLNILAHKSLLAAYAHGHGQVTKKAVQTAIKDSGAVLASIHHAPEESRWHALWHHPAVYTAAACLFTVGAVFLSQALFHWL